jgi:hypothetical protein
MNAEIEKANDLAVTLRGLTAEHWLDGNLVAAAETIERLAAGLNWALVAIERKGSSCDVANINALIRGEVPTDRAY